MLQPFDSHFLPLHLHVQYVPLTVFQNNNHNGKILPIMKI